MQVKKDIQKYPSTRQLSQGLLNLASIGIERAIDEVQDPMPEVTRHVYLARAAERLIHTAGIIVALHSEIDKISPRDLPHVTVSKPDWNRLFYYSRRSQQLLAVLIKANDCGEGVSLSYGLKKLGLTDTYQGHTAFFDALDGLMKSGVVEGSSNRHYFSLTELGKLLFSNGPLRKSVEAINKSRITKRRNTD